MPLRKLKKVIGSHVYNSDYIVQFETVALTSFRIYAAI